MSFEDLPPDWPTRPVTDPEITADLLDLVIRESDRTTGAIGILVCAPSGRLAQPIVVSTPPRHTTARDRRQAFDAVCRAMSEVVGISGVGGLLVAVARPGSPLVSPQDLLWRDAARSSCAEAGVELLGTWLVTPSVIRPMAAEGQRRPA